MEEIKNIRILNKDPYYDMKHAALFTVGKKPRKDDKFDWDWVRKSILSRHTHIRPVLIEIEFETSRPIRDQLLRSTSGFVEKFVESSRPDRTGETRDPNSPSKYLMVFNLEGLVKLCCDRLCTQTEKETRKVINDVKIFMLNSDDEFIRAVGTMLAPKCYWYGNCNEFKTKDCFGVCNKKDLTLSERITSYSYIGGDV